MTRRDATRAQCGQVYGSGAIVNHPAAPPPSRLRCALLLSRDRGSRAHLHRRPKYRAYLLLSVLGDRLLLIETGQPAVPEPEGESSSVVGQSPPGDQIQLGEIWCLERRSYMRSLSRQFWCTVTSSCPVILSTMSSVCCARFRSEVYATSILYLFVIMTGLWGIGDWCLR